MAAITSDTATPALRRVVVNASGRPAFAAMGAAVAELIRRNLVTKDQTPNKLGGRRTHFFAAAARSTFWEAAAGSAMVHIAKDGIRQRLLGGPIRPVNRKFLTIPVSPVSYGRKASEFGGELRLVVINSANPNTAGLLVLGRGSAAPVLFVLSRGVTQEPDPSVLPTDSEMEKAARDGLAEIVLRE